jgi:hypothetical protein
MRYFFHVLDGHEIHRDQEGTIFSSPEVARAKAQVIAKELARGGESYHGLVVYVVSEGGHGTVRVPVVVTRQNV